jgi:protein-S-isoprenylcysteine O-methyltransferase Ste14
MVAAERVARVSVARRYFALQAAGGAAWWIAVFASDDVRNWTLGRWDPAVLVGPDLLLFVGTSALAALWGSRTAAALTAAWTTAVTCALAFYGLVEQAAGWGVVLMAVATLGTLAATATVWFGHLPTGWFFVGPFSFRVAAEAPGVRHLRRSLAQLVVFWMTFFVVVPLVLVTVEERLLLRSTALDSDLLRWYGAAALILGSALGLWACITMALRGDGTPLPVATARELVIAGPYGSIRNPMAVAGVLQTMGIGLLVSSWMVIASAVVGALAWNELIRPTEEADLAARFGEPYQHYAHRVRCWIPICPWRRSEAT